MSGRAGERLTSKVARVQPLERDDYPFGQWYSRRPEGRLVAIARLESAYPLRTAARCRLQRVPFCAGRSQSAILRKIPGSRHEIPLRGGRAALLPAYGHTCKAARPCGGQTGEAYMRWIYGNGDTSGGGAGSGTRTNALWGKGRKRYSLLLVISVIVMAVTAGTTTAHATDISNLVRHGSEPSTAAA